MTRSDADEPASDPDTPDGTSRTRPVLRDAAYQRFMEHMFRGDLRPGRMISQRELCALTGSPISAMREALKRLEAEGLISLIPQRGVLVREVPARELEEAYQLRAILEVFAVRKYAQTCDPALIASLRRSTEEALALKPTGSDDMTAFFQARIAADEMLHAAVIGALDSAMALSVFEKIIKTIRLARLGIMPRFAAQAPALHEHLVILDALARHDADAAAAAMQTHLDRALLRALGID